jgi:hypothetical protein
LVKRAFIDGCKTALQDFAGPFYFTRTKRTRLVLPDPGACQDRLGVLLGDDRDALTFGRQIQGK